MVKVSAYVKGDRNSSSYYRYYQYFDKIENIDIKYHVMYPKWVENHFSPVGYQPLFIKVIVYIVAYFRMLIALLVDLYYRPNTIIVSRRIINKYMPRHFKCIFSLILRRGAYFAWDFDDHILEGRELTKSDFDFFSRKANVIFVTHQFLKDQVDMCYHHKTFIMPTTDGDMYKEAGNPILLKDRKETFKNMINLVWVAYSVNLEHLKTAVPALDKAAKKLKKPLILNVVCDKPLEGETESLIINNVKWTKKSAIESMMNAHIGIMPLKPSEYSKGKGGFKLVQYISIGLPCIASNVGFNREVLGDNVCGLLVETQQEWYNAVIELSKEENWEYYSSRAFTQWKEHFSFERNLHQWEEVIKNHRI